jgi:hypothetical protein
VTDGQYPGYCRDKGLPLDTLNAAWRLRVEEGDEVFMGGWISERNSRSIYTHTCEISSFAAATASRHIMWLRSAMMRILE